MREDDIAYDETCQNRRVHYMVTTLCRDKKKVVRAERTRNKKARLALGASLAATENGK